MQETTQDKLTGIMRKVAALLAQADHPNTGVAEADTFRAKAEALMYQYRIEESQLATHAGTEPTPEWRTMSVCPYSNEFSYCYKLLFQHVVQHFECQHVFDHQRDESTQELQWVAQVCGYASDLQFIEAMYTDLRMAFGGKLEPKYDPALSEQVNAYNMRGAGMEGHRIAQAIYGSDAKSLRVKVRGMFKKECEVRGEDPDVLLGKGNNVKIFREQFSQSFVSTLGVRLREMRQSRGQQSGALVMVSRTEAIKEMFWDRYPQFRPVDRQGTHAPYEAPNKGCPKCARAKSGYCRDHSYLKPSQAKSRTVSQATYDRAMDARVRGSQAAKAVDIGGAPSDHRLR